MTRAERRRQIRGERKAARAYGRSPALRAVPLLLAGIVAILVGGYVLAVRSTGGGAEAPATVEAAAAALEQTATANAGGAVRKYDGSRHTVFHSNDPLPDARHSAPDARPTLVWFSGTSCEYCEQMEPFAHSTAATFGDRVRFVEKSVDHDRAAAARYAVRGTPTFVLIDGSGREISRFFFQPTARAFTQAIEAALKRAG